MYALKNYLDTDIISINPKLLELIEYFESNFLLSRNKSIMLASKAWLTIPKKLRKEK